MFGVHFNAFEDLAAHSNDLIIDNILFIGHGQHGLQHAGRMVDIVRAAHGRQQYS